METLFFVWFLGIVLIVFYMASKSKDDSFMLLVLIWPITLLLTIGFTIYYLYKKGKKT